MQNHSVNRRTSTQTLPSENCTLRFDLCLEITAIYRLPPRLSFCRLRLLGLRQKLRRSPSDIHRHVLDVYLAVLDLVSEPPIGEGLCDGGIAVLKAVPQRDTAALSAHRTAHSIVLK